jgi:hypothetical protein
MNSNMAKASSTAHASLIQAFHKKIVVPAMAAATLGLAFIIWETVIVAPALDFGSYGQVHFQGSVVTPGTEPLLCFDAIEWKRLCPGQTFVRLTPVNVSDPKAVAIDLEPHAQSMPMATGIIPPKCRSAKIPAGISAPGVWRLTGHAANTCVMWAPLVGSFTVTVMSPIPSTLVAVKMPTEIVRQ